MPSEIFLSRNNQSFGPYVTAEVVTLIENGQFTLDDLAWREGLAEWMPLRTVLERISQETPAGPSQLGRDEEAEPGFLRQILSSFLYPFRGEWAGVLLVFTILMSVVAIGAGHAQLIGIFAMLILTSYYLATLLKIIRDSAMGEDEFTEFPGFSGDIQHDFLRPLLQVYFALLVCVFPFTLADVYLAEAAAELQWIPYALLGVGLFFLPMVLLTTAVLDSVLNGLNPLLIVPGIYRIFFRYTFVVFLLVVIVFFEYFTRFLLEGWTSNQLLLLTASGAMGIASLYGGFIGARLIGMIYRTSSEQIGWFNR